jgi:hypothetical protein
MRKVVVIHQPDFMPYLGFFHRLLYADEFVILDNVQFLRRGWHHRDKIKTDSGEKWLTVGVKKASQNTLIKDIILNEENWKEQHVNLIKNNYKKSKFFTEIFPYIEKLYDVKVNTMIDFNMASIEILLELFDINIKKEYSSKFKMKTVANELLVDILKVTNATHYLSGVGAKDYFISKPFDDAKIEVIWQDLKYPTYPQLHGEFIPYLSSIDLLFNCGIEKSRELLRGI